MDIGKPQQIIVKPFGIITPAKGGEKIIALGKYILLSQVPGIVQIARLDIMKREGIDRFVIERIAGAAEVFPSLIFGSISDIGLAVITCAQFCIGAGAKPET